MRLLFLHGPVAAGKYTVARELAARTGYELHHNHLVVDDVLRTHAFGTPGFVAARDRRWRDFFEKSPGPAMPNVIFTFNPENTVPQTFIDWLFAEMDRRGVAICSVEITAAEAVIESRLGSDSRQQFRKLVDPTLYRALRSGGAFDSPRIPRTDLRIDSGLLAPDESASQVVAAFGL